MVVVPSAPVVTKNCATAPLGLVSVTCTSAPDTGACSLLTLGLMTADLLFPLRSSTIDTVTEPDAVPMYPEDASVALTLNGNVPDAPAGGTSVSAEETVEPGITD